MEKKKFPLQFTLSTIIATLIIIVSLSLIIISYIGSSNSVLYLSQNMVNEISKGIIEKTKTILNSAEKANMMTEFLIKNKELDLTNGDSLLKYTKQVVSVNEEFSSVDIGITTGEKYKAERMPDNSISTRSYIRTKTNVIMTYYHDNPEYKDKFKNSIKDLAKGYDSRTRPWWTTAVTNKKLSWTDLYISGTQKQFVYSNAIPIYNDKNELISVSSIDINVVSLSEFLGTLKILKTGKSIIVNDKNQVIAMPVKKPEDLDQLLKKNDKDPENPYELYKVEELPDFDIKAAFIQYNKNLLNGKTNSSFEYTGLNGNKFIAHIINFPYKADTNFKIGIIISKKDLVEKINQNNIITLILAFIFLIIALLIGILITKNITKSLISLTKEVNKVSKLDLDSKAVINTSILEVAKINDSVENMKIGLKSFKKYVPADLVLQLNKLQKEAVLEGDRKQLTIFFSDIADFTSISESLTPEKLVENLGIYFAGMSKTILESNGTIDKYIGDSIMAFWGAPSICENHALLACKSAINCQKFLNDLEIQWKGREWSPIFNTRIGIHTGEVIVGNIGYDERMNYTIIGDNVNLASRIEGLNKYYDTKIIISENTFESVKNDFVTRKLDCVSVKGKSKSIFIYELVAFKNQIEKEKESFINLFNQGIDLYFEKKWNESNKIFEETYKISKNMDLPSKIFIERSQNLLKNPPKNDWDGTCQFESK